MGIGLHLIGGRATPPDRRRSAVEWLCLVVLPVLTVVGVLHLKEAQGPYWLGTNLDPAYIHLFNGLNVALLKAPVHYDQPGTPLQIATGAFIRLMHLVSGRDGLPLDVLERPEAYLNGIQGVFLASYALILFWAGAAVLRATGSGALALAIQTGPFLSTNGVEALTRVSPEALLMHFSLVFAVILFLHAERGAAADDVRFATAAGVVAGLLVATKLTALPLAAIPLFFFFAPVKRRALAAYLLTSAALFVLATLLILPKYGALFRWALRVVTHRGFYGGGPPGLEEPAQYLRFLGAALLAEKAAVVLGLFAAAVLWIAFRGRAATNASPRGARLRLLSALLLALGVQFLLSSKQPMTRYLVPALGTLGALAAVALSLLRDLEGPRPGTRPVLLGAAVTALAFLEVRSLREVHAWRSLERTAQERIVDEAAKRYGTWPKLYSYSASSLSYALHFGNRYVADSHSGLLSVLHPGIVFHDPFAKSFSSFAGPVTATELAARSPFLYQALPLEGYLGWRLDPPANATFRLLLATPVEALYEARFREPDSP
jgi:hypothetical protein